ncbi:MAG TPA: MBL fold metallo-hydrolase [Clostridia bacterium]|nr:MBL fold metallo-hydrolase [Clostridia bacterium]
MIFKCFPVGMFESNSYILGSQGEGIVIDAGIKSSYITEFAEKNYLKIKYIILTHSHIDHICHIDEIKNATGALVAVHEEDAKGLVEELYNLSALMGMNKAFGKADILLKDGDSIEVGDLRFDIIHTPGHTKGCICVKSEKMLFTGDTLFRMSVGRTDLLGGSRQELKKSILDKLMKFEDDTIVYTGHGESSTIGYEREHNPFIKLGF